MPCCLAQICREKVVVRGEAWKCETGLISCIFGSFNWRGDRSVEEQEGGGFPGKEEREGEGVPEGEMEETTPDPRSQTLQYLR